MTDEETPFDPDDWDALEEMHREMKEFMAAENVMAWAEVDPQRVRNLIASSFAVNRTLRDSLESITMIIERLRPEDKGPEEVKKFRLMLAEHLKKITSIIFVIPADPEEE